MTHVALVDDHVLVRHALAEFINQFDDFQVSLQANHGKDFLSILATCQPLPSIVLLDINMPVMDGFETATLLSQHYPSITILALSVNDDEESIIKMLRCGAKGYLLKDTETDQFKVALDELVNKGYYHSELVSNTLLRSIQPNKNNVKKLVFHAREEEFIQWACSELTYKEIAERMCLSPRTIDGYRENLFERLEVKSRVGLVLFAIRQGVFKV